MKKCVSSLCSQNEKKKNRFSAPDEYVMTKYIYSRLPHTVNTHAFIKNSCFI